jgi:sortase A
MNWRSSVLRNVHRLLLWTGAVVLTYAGGATAYSAAYQRYQAREFQQAVLAGAQTPADLHEGDLVGKLEISRIGLSVMVLQGMEETTLSVGAGHVPGTPLPGLGGNVVIAAHRDTFFRKLKDIVPGDRIRVSIGARAYDYIVGSTETLDPADTWVMTSRASEELTLITCFPFYFVGNAPKRFIVHAVPAAASHAADVR